MKSMTRNGGLLAGLIFTSMSHVHAAFVVDHFASPLGGQATGITNGIVGSTSTSFLSGLPILGGSREIHLAINQIYDVGNQSDGSANSNTSPDYLSYSNDANVASTLRLTWDASGGGLNTSLVAETGLELLSTFNDSATSYTISLETFGGGISTQTVSTGALFSGDVSFLLGGFVGGANLNDIDRIILSIDGGRASDVTIHALEAVPEPSSAGLAVVGAAALGLLRRRRV